MNVNIITPKKEKTHDNILYVKISPVKVPEGAKQIGNYILGKTIGSGTFGKVHLGLHIPTGQRVAVKIIDKVKLNQNDKERIHRQVQILKKILHPSLIQLYQIIETQKSLLFVMEYVQNGQLFNYIIKKQKLSEDQACRIFHQIIDGIQYMHNIGVAHRDLKPENILIDFDGKIKIIDFGLSNTYQKNEKLKTQCGSPCYAAPEMIQGKHRYDPLAIDIWSTGIVLFAMIAGYLPFCDSDTSKLYKKIMAGNFKFPQGMSQNAKDLISKMLVVNPNKRATLSQIIDHPWFQNVEIKKTIGIDTRFYKVPVETSLITNIQYLGLKVPNFASSIESNIKSKETALYYLIAKKLARQGNQLPNIFSSENFDHTLLVPWQSLEDQGIESTFVEVESVSAVAAEAEISSPQSNSSLFQFYTMKSSTFQPILNDFLNLPPVVDDLMTTILKSNFYANNLQNKKKRQSLKIQKPYQIKSRSLFQMDKKERSTANGTGMSKLVPHHQSPKKLLPSIKDIYTKTQVFRINRYRQKAKSNLQKGKLTCKKITTLDCNIQKRPLDSFAFFSNFGI